MSSGHQEIFYFGAGPATLPRKVLKQIKEELVDYQSTGLSILEHSHRSELFIELMENAEHVLRELMAITEDYSVLFLHGGATAQYSMLPINFLDKNDIADYICTGHWSSKACEEAKQFARINEIQALEQNEKSKIKPVEKWNLNSNSVYLHYCNNETINGISYPESIKLDRTIVCDMTSSILTSQMDINDYDLIYASAQKNLGIAGLCIVIVRTDLLNKVKRNVPRVFNYKLCYENKSLVNTPPIFAIYVLGLMLNWLNAQGGVNEVDKLRKQHASEIYSLIDSSELYQNNVDLSFRSNVNIPFTIENEKVQEEFLLQAENNKLLGLRGHKSVGGLRISIYNAMPIQGVQKLIEFMHDFEKNHAKS